MTDLRKRIEELTGKFDPNEHLTSKPIYNVEEELKLNSITYKKISILVDRKDKVPAFLLHSEEIQPKSPGILALHQTTEDHKVGAKEAAGLDGNKNYHYGLELAKLGFVVIIPDYPFFGSYEPLVSSVYNDYGYESMTMKGLINHIASINVLTSLSFVDSQQIGCIGHSLGGTNTLFVSYFDSRIKCSVVSAGFTSFEAYARTSKAKDLSRWALREKYMPNVEIKFNNDPVSIPFDFHELMASLCPLPLFLSTPMYDEIFDIQGARRSIRKVKNKYAACKLSSNLVHVEPEVKHDFPDVTRRQSYQFLMKYLKSTGNAL